MVEKVNSASDKALYRRERRRSLTTGEKIALLAIGGGIGAILALLFAPKPGEDLREDIADAARPVIDRARTTAVDFGERAGQVYETTKDRAGELYGTTRERADTLYKATKTRTVELIEATSDSTARLVEQVRDTTRPGGTFAAAIEAGKQAYYEEKRRTESLVINTGRPTYKPEKVIAAGDDQNVLDAAEKTLDG